MAENTGIEWCDSTFNPWIGCTRVSPACDDCYAARSTPARTLGLTWGAGQPRRLTSEANWKLPTRWNSKRFMQCEDCGWRGEAAAPVVGCGRCGSIELSDTRRRVFCASLADVFDNEVDPAWRVDLFLLMIATPHLEWLLLTKRIGNVARMVREQHLAWPRNAALGFTVVNQDELNRDWRKAANAAMAVQPLHLFASIEPMLGPMRLDRVDTASDFDDWTYCDNALTGFQATKGGGYDGPKLDWVICGGESGPKARPMHPDWARSLRDQCAAAGVPFLFKQWGEWTPGENVERQRGVVDTAFLDDAGESGSTWSVYPLNLTTDEGHIDDQPDLYRVGKKAAGRLLDGTTHDGFPEVAHG